MRLLFPFVFGATTLCAQPISFGIKGGVPLTDSLKTTQEFPVNSSTANNRYVVGPMVELRLPFGLAVELDALYRRVNYNNSFFSIGDSMFSRTTGNAWEFPLLAKYRFPSKVVRPYAEAGAAWDTLSGLTQTTTSFLFSGSTVTTTSSPPELHHTTTTGFVMGGGIDIHAIFIHVSPELRYTRWANQHFVGSVESNQNQVEFLIGLTF
jgi:hypothetical protein